MFETIPKKKEVVFMNKFKYVLVVVGLTLVFGLVLLGANQRNANAQECSLVTIHGSGFQGSAYVEPTTLWVPRDGCVTWVNWDRSGDVNLVVSDTKKCDKLTSVPGKVKTDVGEACKVNVRIPVGQALSLNFLDVGTYHYLVKPNAVSPGRLEGMIMVSAQQEW
jgi:hypothetical protein